MARREEALGLVLDVLRAVGVAQRRDGLVVVVVDRADVRDHHRLRVPAERVLQHPRELRVAVRDVRRPPVDQRGDAVAERREREVDLGGLLQPVTRRTRLALPLRTGLRLGSGSGLG